MMHFVDFWYLFELVDIRVHQIVLFLIDSSIIKYHRTCIDWFLNINYGSVQIILQQNSGVCIKKNKQVLGKKEATNNLNSCKF